MRQPSLFLIRPPALPGESLTSWRQRSAWSNGYTLFPIADERLRRVDSDLGLHDADLNWVAAAHNLTFQQVVCLTLRGQIGKVVDHLATRSQPSWWLRARQGSEKRPFGPMFCAECLKSDAIPYFRLSWRYGFITQCVVHGYQLFDQCPVCFHPPWPGATGIKNRLAGRFDSLKYCWHCRFDLSTLPTVPGNDDIAALMTEGLSHGSVRCGADMLPVLDVLHALRGICQLFLRNRARQKILLSTTPWVGFIEGMSDTAKSTNSVDYLCVADRQYLLPGAWRILADWPISFLEFAKQTGISRLHFNGAQDLQPPWMNQTIDEKLALQNRTVTPEVIAKTINELVSQTDARLSKAAVRRRLNWSGERGLDAHFVKRRQANDSEVAQFCESALSEICQTRDFKRSHRHALMDIATLLLCVHNELTIENACTLPIDVQRRQFAEISAEPPMSTLLQKVVDGLGEIPAMFQIAAKAQPRQVRKRLVRLMSRLDENLLRDVSIFR